MMTGIGKYIISIVAAIVSCSVLTGLVSDSKGATGLVRILCGVFIAITVVKPLLGIDLEDLSTYWNGIHIDGDAIAQEGRSAAITESSVSIKQELESYILEKADDLDTAVDVDINLTDEFPPMPESIEITGSVSPYNKRVLSEYIYNEIGIPEDKQIWK